MKQRIISGMQVTGNLHIGNYLGAMKNWIKMQSEYECLFFLANLHSITVDFDPVILKNNTIKNAAVYLACGLQPEKSIIFVQSEVRQHTEFAWFLNCITPLGWLNRMTQFKDKSRLGEESNLGLLSYPVLMAADILLYSVDKVPVGSDQKQHLELVRDIAKTLNKKFPQDVFKLPEAVMDTGGSRIMSLRDGNKKMSKSGDTDNSRINLLDPEDVIIQKIKKAKTDSINYFSYNQELRPEITNLLNIFSELSGKKVDKVIDEYNSLGFEKFKKDLAELVINLTSKIKSEVTLYLADQGFIKNILSQGAVKASEIAETKIREVKDSFGII